MNAKNILTMSLSLPALLVGLGLLAASLFSLATIPGTLVEKFNSATVFYFAFAAFALISIATIVASRSGFGQSKAFRQLFKYSISAASILVGILLICMVGLLGYHAI